MRNRSFHAKELMVSTGSPIPAAAIFPGDASSERSQSLDAQSQSDLSQLPLVHEVARKMENHGLC